MYALTGQHCHGAINGIVKSLMFEEMNVSRVKISKEFHCLCMSLSYIFRFRQQASKFHIRLLITRLKEILLILSQHIHHLTKQECPLNTDPGNLCEKVVRDLTER